MIVRSIGGLSMFGDPLGAAKSVAGGVRSLFYEPVQVRGLGALETIGHCEI